MEGQLTFDGIQSLLHNHPVVRCAITARQQAV